MQNVNGEHQMLMTGSKKTRNISYRTMQKIIKNDASSRRFLVGKFTLSPISNEKFTNKLNSSN